MVFQVQKEPASVRLRVRSVRKTSLHARHRLALSILGIVLWWLCNIPLAAAFTVVPMAIMGVYLWVAKRMGAFDVL